MDLNIGDFCKICLQSGSPHQGFQLDFKEQHKSVNLNHTKLLLCYPELDLRSVSTSTMCLSCATAIEVIEDFINKCFENEQRIKDHLSISRSMSDFAESIHILHSLKNYRFDNKNDARQTGLGRNERVLTNGLVYSKTNKGNYANTNLYSNICRTCLRIVDDNSPTFSLNYIDTNSEPISIRNKLHLSFPELDLNVLPNTILCSLCLEVVDITYHFKTLYYIAEIKYNEHCTMQMVKDSLLNVTEKTSALDNTKLVPKKKKPTFKDYLDNLKKMKDKRPLSLNPKNKYAVNKGSYLSAFKKMETAKRPVSIEPKYNKPDSNMPKYYLECQKCDYKTTIKDILKKAAEQKPFSVDMSRPEPEFTKYYECPKCDYRTTTRSHLTLHAHMHDKQYRGVLVIAPKSKTSKTAATMENAAYKCLKCKYYTTARSSIIKHLNIHVKENPFKCSKCDYSTKLKGNLKIHMIMHSREKPYKCKHCNYQAKSKLILKAHLLVHSGEKPFKCDKCDYSATSNSNLNRHVLCHTGERPFTCTACGYNARTKSCLKKHVLIHTGETPYKCKQCDYSSRSSSDLKRHMFIHSGGKRFKCTQCDYGASRRSFLDRHLLLHINNKKRCNVKLVQAAFEKQIKYCY